jgi:hypothetical protein
MPAIWRTKGRHSIGTEFAGVPCQVRQMAGRAHQEAGFLSSVGWHELVKDSKEKASLKVQRATVKRL